MKFNTLDDLMLLVDQIPTSIFWMDFKGYILGCNSAQTQVLSTSKTNLIGKHVNQVLPEEAAKVVLENNEAVLKFGTLLSRYESTIVDGKEKNFITKKAPLRNAKGDIEGVIGLSLDITTEYQAQLRKFQMYEHIISLVPAHVYWKGLDGKYLGCNDQQAKSAGLKSRDEFVGKTDLDFPWRASAEKLKKIDQQIIESGKEFVCEETGYMADGMMHTYISHKSPLLDDEGKIIGIVGVSVDISQQKELERLRAERAQMAQLMAASIAHEIRTPLAAVNMYANNLRTMLPTLIKSFLNHEAKASPGLVKRAKELEQVPDRLDAVTQAAHTFIDMMLMKVDLEKAKPQVLHPLSMMACLHDALSLYPLTPTERALVHIDKSRDFMFKGDITLMRHVFFNLIKNALFHIKAANKGEIKIWMMPGETENKLYFRDTGLGIAPEALPNLFGHFYSKTRHGTGIGLSLCKMIMEEFKGKITCESTYGEYATFTLAFPILEKLL